METALGEGARRGAHSPGTDSLSGLAELLAEKIPMGTKVDKVALAKALHDALDARDDRGRAARRQIQMHVWEVNERLAYGRPAAQDERMLSTEEAAQLMKKSRPHVAMLIDAGILENATTTPKGHRRVPESSVRAWLSKREEAVSSQPGDADYKSAARDAGMYAIAESAYIEDDASGSKRG